MEKAVFIGYDPREPEAFRVAFNTMRDATSVPVIPLDLRGLIDAGIYTRPTIRRSEHPDHPVFAGNNDVLYDEISGAPMSTEFAISRFFIPHLMRYSGLALFVDADVMVRGSIDELWSMFANRPSAAIACVHHTFNPPAGTKMEGQTQTRYFRKNWSSVMVMNCARLRILNLPLLNSAPGRDLHGMQYVAESDILELGGRWNYLVGHSATLDPVIVHYTDGTPNLPGHEEDKFADEWRRLLSLEPRHD